MFNDIKNIQEGLTQLDIADNTEDFESAVKVLQEYMRNQGIGLNIGDEIEKRAYYLPNEYSDRDTKIKMNEAKKRVIEYIAHIMDIEIEDKVLLKVLDNYYLFLENLIERKPHKKGGIREENLECLKVKNEYDIQHLLYAYIKPLYPLARAEVNEDTGYGTARTDILIDADHVIELKCTRKTMKLKKLTEEIEADIVHYSAKNIYFFIYDKEKIIENPMVFKKNYEEIIKEKYIHIIIHQPKLL